MTRPILYCLIGFIMSVTVYDIYCTVKMADYLYCIEDNPIAELLIEKVTHTIHHNASQNGLKNVTYFITTDVSNLILVKVLGAMIALIVLLKLVESKYTQLATCVVSALTGFQTVLLLYLVS